MKKIKPILNSHILSPRCDPAIFSFATTVELEDLPDIIGQARALDAALFGIRIKGGGYNLFALGPPGVGKRSVIRKILLEEAGKQQPPPDWCYLYNFENSQKPIAISLPAGQGIKFRDDMGFLIEELKISIPVMFESETYRHQMQLIADEFSKTREQIVEKLEEEARKENLTILSTQTGFVIAPVNEKGEVLSDRDFEKLSEKEREKNEKLIQEFTEKLKKDLQKIPGLHREQREREKDLQTKLTKAEVGHYIDELKKKYQVYNGITKYLDAVEYDIIANIKNFLKRESAGLTAINEIEEKSGLLRYQVNVIVDNSKLSGAPVFNDDNPTYINLVGRVENIAQFGVLITNFTLIRPGSLHLANGGFLIIDIVKLLSQPFSWEGLKRALYAKKIIIEPPSQIQGLFSSMMLEPEPIPLDIKVVLLGDREFYYLLCALDQDFSELFKVAVDFEEEIERNVDNLQLYAKMIATLGRKEGLKPFDCAAVARIVDKSSRMVSDSEKISIHLRSIVDLLREADYFSSVAGKKIITADDVEKAIEAQIKRLDRVRQKFYEEIQRNLILIDTTGKKIGQINGISTVQLGDFCFGYPARITATVHVGKGEVVNIEREINLSGAIHSKGVLTLAGFLSGTYSKNKPFSISACLTIEQNYGFVEGDSATLAELCALLSVITNIPLKQSLAVTGSVNQYGLVQPVGAINEKIEGFFDICHARELTNEQGVIIPKENVKNLILRQDVVEAITNKKFFVYPVATVDEAMTLLTNLEAGKRDKKGNFPPNTINYQVENCLKKFVKHAKG